jgi:hypothetical protein
MQFIKICMYNMLGIRLICLLFLSFQLLYNYVQENVGTVFCHLGSFLSALKLRTEMTFCIKTFPPL